MIEYNSEIIDKYINKFYELNNNIIKLNEKINDNKYCKKIYYIKYVIIDNINDDEKSVIVDINKKFKNIIYVNVIQYIYKQYFINYYNYFTHNSFLEFKNYIEYCEKELEYYKKLFYIIPNLRLLTNSESSTLNTLNTSLLNQYYNAKSIIQQMNNYCNINTMYSVHLDDIIHIN